MLLLPCYNIIEKTVFVRQSNVTDTMLFEEKEIKPWTEETFLIGSGGFGVVYGGVIRHTPVAIKVY